MNALDVISSTKREATYRRRLREKANLPSLRVYPRVLCDRTTHSAASTSRAAVRKQTKDQAIIWETKLEEVLERDLAYDPELVADILTADVHWSRRNKSRTSPYDPNRVIEDVCDGQIWASHPFLGDPDYDGPPRLAFTGYCDDIDIPNPIGPHHGNHKLFLCYTILLNRAPHDRLRLGSVNLASICLASDAKLVSMHYGPSVLISGFEDEDFNSSSLGAAFRRLHEGVTLKTPACSGVDELHVRGWLLGWTCDGKAAGEIFGTNSSFSKAHNICNLCEDGLQTDRKKNHTPCGFLCCKCPEDDDEHMLGCKCHFRLRTPNRDQQRLDNGSTPAKRQRLGIVTEDHAFVRVPHVHISRPGPKDVMHVFLEGVTRHFSAYVLYMIFHTRRASKAEIQSAIQTFNYGGGLGGFHKPGFVPDSIYTRTKIIHQGKPDVWGPHSDAKLPYSAYGILVFTVHSLEVLRDFFSKGEEMPVWWTAWVLHVKLVSMLMRVSYTVADLFQMEETIIAWQKAFFSVPEFYACWKPKHHWALHAAHDVWRWGPPRYLWCMIMEMKNAEFKRACKRSNFHNPTKATALFWCEASAHALSRKKKRRGCCDSSAATVLGSAAHLCSTDIGQQLLGSNVPVDWQAMDCVSEIIYHGVLISRCAYVLTMEGRSMKLWYVMHILRSHHEQHVLCLSECCNVTEEQGMLSAPLAQVRAPVGRYRLLSAESTNFLGTWHYMDDEVGLLRLIVKW